LIEFLKEIIAIKNKSIKGKLIAVLINNLSRFIIFLNTKEEIKKPIKILVNAGAMDIENGIIIME